MSEQVLLLPYFYKGVIYLIENIQDRKKYIGKTTQEVIPYVEGHFYAALRNVDKNKKYLYRAIRKYGRENFKWWILGEVYDSTEKELNDRLNEAEIDCIYHFRTFGSDGKHRDDIYGYNQTKGGDGWSKGHTPWNKGLTKETDQRIKDYSENSINKKKLKGKTLEEIHGFEKAVKIKKKIKNRHIDCIYINKNGLGKRIKKDDLQIYLMQDWKIGCSVKRTNIIFIGTKIITKNKKNKRIKENEVSTYLNLGWELGMYRENKHLRWLNNNIINIKVSENNIYNYLNSGWKLGRISWSNKK
jgi:hypothetical protein